MPFINFWNAVQLIRKIIYTLALLMIVHSQFAFLAEFFFAGDSSVVTISQILLALRPRLLEAG